MTFFGQDDKNTSWEGVPSEHYSWGVSFSSPVHHKSGCVEVISWEGLMEELNIFQ